MCVRTADFWYGKSYTIQHMQSIVVWNRCAPFLDVGFGLKLWLSCAFVFFLFFFFVIVVVVDKLLFSTNTFIALVSLSLCECLWLCLFVVVVHTQTRNKERTRAHMDFTFSGEISFDVENPQQIKTKYITHYIASVRDGAALKYNLPFHANHIHC